MNIEEKLSYLTGQIDTLRFLCCTLVVLYPMNSTIIELIKSNLKKAEEISSSTQSDIHYKNGIKAVLEEIDTLSYLAVSAQQSASQKPGKHN